MSKYLFFILMLGISTSSYSHHFQYEVKDGDNLSTIISSISIIKYDDDINSFVQIIGSNNKINNLDYIQKGDTLKINISHKNLMMCNIKLKDSFISYIDKVKTSKDRKKTLNKCLTYQRRIEKINNMRVSIGFGRKNIDLYKKNSHITGNILSKKNYHLMLEKETNKYLLNAKLHYLQYEEDQPVITAKQNKLFNYDIKLFKMVQTPAIFMGIGLNARSYHKVTSDKFYHIHLLQKDEIGPRVILWKKLTKFNLKFELGLLPSWDNGYSLQQEMEFRYKLNHEIDIFGNYSFEDRTQNNKHQIDNELTIGFGHSF